MRDGIGRVCCGAWCDEAVAAVIQCGFHLLQNLSEYRKDMRSVDGVTALGNDNVLCQVGANNVTVSVDIESGRQLMMKVLDATIEDLAAARL